MLEQIKKRERNANFSREETEKLVFLVETFINIIENKKSDAETWQEKEKAWKAIEIEFNSSGAGVYRDAKHLKLKYEALKRDTRKKSSCGVNEGAPLTPVEQKVRQIISLSVEGSESAYDSEPLEVNVDVQILTENEKPEEVIVLADGNGSPASLVGHINDTDTDNYSNNLTFTEISKNPPQKRRLEHADDDVPSTSKQVCQDTADSKQMKCAKCKLSCKPKKERLFAKLTKEKMEIVELRKKIIQEELQEKFLKKQMMNAELKHKLELYGLEKEEMLLKIDILKCELENKKEM